MPYKDPETRRKKAAEYARRARLLRPHLDRAATTKYRATNIDKARAASRAWAARHPGRNKATPPAKQKLYRRRFNLKSKFGMSMADYERMLHNQKGGCGICGGGNKNGRALAVDHCHAYRHVRGLLCSRCNLGIGTFHDNADLLSKAIAYLKQNEAI